ncbi:MAG: flippase-like domain-containing protein [Pirellulales bacterium]|nr:flippase-like domain-containing protein [Pirellulales bacterium]
MKRFVIAAIKIGLSAGIIAYLVRDAQQNQAFSNLCSQPKQWWLLAAAWLACAGAVLLTLIRWHLLIRAVAVPSTLRNSLRIGFLGFFVNLSPMGIVGGDLLKAVMLGRNHPGSRAKCAASVVIDRVIGLYMLFVVATVAILMSQLWQLPVPAVRQVCYVTFAITAVGAVGLGIMMIPAVTEGRLAQWLSDLPRVGRLARSLIESVRIYGRSPGVLAVAALLSVGVHSLFALGVFLIACGLPGNVHSLGAHFVVTPLASATGVIPLPLGPFEYVLDSLYAYIPLAGAAIPKGQGLVVALAYRIINVLIAMIGAGYYFAARRELAEVLHEADQASDVGSGPTVVMAQEYRPASAA